MKKIIIFILALAALPAAAEIVSEISFNPSRLGEYKFLKIAKDANFRGGLVTKNLNLTGKSGAKLNINSKMTNDTTTAISAKYLKRTASAPAVTLNMSGAKFMNGASSIPEITWGGGNLNFSNSNATDTKITQLCGSNNCSASASDKMDLTSQEYKGDTATLEVHNSASGNISVFGTQVKGLKLAGNDIPDFRNGNNVMHCTSASSCSFTNKQSSEGTLQFVQRKTKTNETVKVLAFVLK